MSWFSGDGTQLLTTAAKAALMYGTALVALRVSERRTLAQWSAMDFVAAVAIGAIVGRTAIADTQTYLVGAVALLTLLLVHRLVVRARFLPKVARLVDHRARLLVSDGRVLDRELRRSGLTEEDLLGQLRQRGITSLSSVRFVIFEGKGGLTIVQDPVEPDHEVLRSAIEPLLGGYRAGSSRGAAQRRAHGTDRPNHH